MRKAKNATLPHWPGETQASFVVSSRATIAPLVGLKRCLPFQRMRNLPAMAMTAPAASTQAWLLRRRRQSESAEMSALRGSNRGRRQIFVQSHCVARAVAVMRMARPGVTSNPRWAMPYRRRSSKAPI